MNYKTLSVEDVYAYLLNLVLLDTLPEARVIWSDKLDDYGAYYVLLPMNKKVFPLEIGKTYQEASGFVSWYGDQFKPKLKVSMLEKASLQ